MSTATANKMNLMLRGVVTDGTGTTATVDGYTVIGKTGTARKPQPGGGYTDEERRDPVRVDLRRRRAGRGAGAVGHRRDRRAVGRQLLRRRGGRAGLLEDRRRSACGSSRCPPPVTDIAAGGARRRPR